ncbi:hypothetical protein [uncultured Roseobacter sp.]|uniref:hypothetical protein n=1 Tax=uncultured Roseobacter sp. TaxID=114847 RepID=UPI0026305D32|nr:hypothetical protein [uncultured Roseobacter sp.]
MPELLPEECDCQDEDIDILTGAATCHMCGSRRYLTTKQLDRLSDLQAEYDEYCHQLETEQQEAEPAEMERREMESHFEKHPHG